MSSTEPSDVRQRNKRLAVWCAAGFFTMITAAYASVPLYRAFCELTGFDGTPRRAQQASAVTLERSLVVRFDANVRELPWTFRPQQTAQTLKIGQTGLAYFTVTNNSDQPVTGHAVYNVTPQIAGAYFQKLECFCFSNQTIPAGKTIEFPVVYFVDPKFAEDFDTRGKTEVTLSYTFFPAQEAETKSAEAPSALGGTLKAGL
ncbi:MAG: cytochrome c oxidase assembly protein [Phenylobacterium sp.]